MSITIARAVRGTIVPVKRIVGDNPRDDEVVYLAKDSTDAAAYIKAHQGTVVDGKYIGPALYTTVRDTRARLMKKGY